MKKVITILFVSIYLFSSTELNQLLKLPVLHEHFKEHHAEDNSLSMMDFILMHYSSNDVNKSDQDEDMKLPFKSPDSCFSASIIAYISQPIGFTEKLVFFTKEPLNNYTYKEFSSSYLSSIWQPPKLSLS